MKKQIIAAIIITAISTPALAETWQEKCEVIGELAHVIMKTRQDGASMPSAMKTANGYKLAELMVSEAYDEPRYGSEEYKANATNDFRDKWYSDCYKVLADTKK